MTTFMTVEQAKGSVRQLEKICTIRATGENLYNLAKCYFILGDLASALPLAEEAFSRDPHNPSFSTGLGLILKDLGEHQAAHDAFKVAYEVADEDPFVRLCYSESLLRQGKWLEAWPIWDDTRSTREASALIVGLPIQVRLWNGKSFVEELLVTEEGGIGDRITYCRWLPKLDEMKIKWKFFPFPELRGFFERASWCGPSKLVGPGDPASASHWTTTHSLPVIFGATPNTVPDLPKDTFRPLPKFTLKYKLAAGRKLPIAGICWQGDESRHGGRKVHSLSEGQAMRLVCKTDHLVHWVNLNYDRALPKPVENPKMQTWEELAGLMDNLDLIVSVETGPMCLADAMRKSLIVLLSSNSDWRFLEDGASPFYPNARLIRNGPGGGLENAIDKTIEAIEFQYKKPALHVVGV